MAKRVSGPRSAARQAAALERVSAVGGAAAGVRQHAAERHRAGGLRPALHAGRRVPGLPRRRASGSPVAGAAAEPLHRAVPLPGDLHAGGAVAARRGRALQRAGGARGGARLCSHPGGARARVRARGRRAAARVCGRPTSLPHDGAAHHAGRRVGRLPQHAVQRKPAGGREARRAALPAETAQVRAARRAGDAAAGERRLPHDPRRPAARRAADLHRVGAAPAGAAARPGGRAARRPHRRRPKGHAASDGTAG